MDVSDYYASLPLSKTDPCVRVLDLDREPTSTLETPLRGSLRVVSLKSRPSFAAPSYVWGAFSEHKNTIACRSLDPGTIYHIDITANCDLALRQLRENVGGPFSIWADAICINQGDVSEKAHQIPLMETIYTWAQPVYLWLGPGTPGSDRAIQYLLASSKVLPPYLWNMREARSTGRREAAAEGLRLAWNFAVGGYSAVLDYIFRNRPLIPARRHFRLRDLRDLLDREWTQRMWTFQEIMLPWEIVLVCGHLSIGWHEFVRPIASVREDRTNVLRSGLLLHDDADATTLATWEMLCSAWLDLPRPTIYGREDSAVSLRKALAGRYRNFWELVMITTGLLQGVPFFLIQQIAFGIPFYYYARRPGYFGADLGINLLVLLLFVLSLIAVCLLAGQWEVRWARPFLWRDTELPRDDRVDAFDSAAVSARMRVGFVTALRERLVAIPQDRSFALHGILTKSGLSLAPPNYAKDEATVLRELFCSMVRWDVSLVRLLADAGRLEGAGVPTWVPDFNARHSWLDSSYLNGTQRDLATNGAKASARFLNDQTLVVNGMAIDTVAYCCERFEELGGGDDGALSHNLSVFLKWLAMARRDTVIPTSFRTLADVIHYILRGGDVPDPDHPRGDFDKLYGLIGQFTAGRINALETPEAAGRVLADLKLPENGTALQHFKYCCLSLAKKRILCISSKGYLCACSEGTRVGDSMALVAGVPVLLILRPGEGTSTVTGPGIAAGLMNGSAWRIKDLENIVLA